MIVTVPAIPCACPVAARAVAWGRLGHLAQGVDQAQPGIGQLHPLARACEQHDAQLLLQCGDLSAYGGLCQAKGARRSRERPRLRGRHNGAGAVPVEGEAFSNPCKFVWTGCNIGQFPSDGSMGISGSMHPHGPGVSP